MSTADNVKIRRKKTWKQRAFFSKEMRNVICYVAHRVVPYKENMYGNLPSGIFGDFDHRNFETAHYKF